jgi:hypothetical protein
VRQDDDIGACNCRWPLPQISAWKQSSIAKRTHGVEEENIEVARQLDMLKSVIEDDGVRIEALYGEHTRGISILPYDHRQPGQMFRQEDWLIASDLRRHEAPLSIRNDCDA